MATYTQSELDFVLHLGLDDNTKLQYDREMVQRTCNAESEKLPLGLKTFIVITREEFITHKGLKWAVYAGYIKRGTGWPSLSRQSVG
jgi:hypothetical protein